MLGCQAQAIPFTAVQRGGARGAGATMPQQCRVHFLSAYAEGGEFEQRIVPEAGPDGRDDDKVHPHTGGCSAVRRLKPEPMPALTAPA